MSQFVQVFGRREMSDFSPARDPATWLSSASIMVPFLVFETGLLTL